MARAAAAGGGDTFARAVARPASAGLLRATSPVRGSIRRSCRPRCVPRTRSGSHARIGGIPVRAAASRSSSRGTHSPWRRPPSWARRSSCVSSAPAATSGSVSSPRPTDCVAMSAATRSATSSRGTSSTRTSATSAAASARSRRADWLRTCAARRISSRSRRSCGARGRRGSAARRRSVSRVGFTPPSRATTTRRSSRRSAPSCPSCTSMRSRRWRSGRARRHSGWSWTHTSRGCERSGSGRCQARRQRSSTTKSVRSSARTRCRPSSGWPCTRPRIASGCART